MLILLHGSVPVNLLGGNMRNIRVYDKILKKYIPLKGIYSFEDPTLVFEEGTAIFDLTKNEIFEGDIVATKDIGFDVVGLVVYMQGSFGINHRARILLTDHCGFIRPMDIIGNINENPELLKAS